MRMQQGDLIYIPSSVDMWNVDDYGSGIKYFKTEKPTVGVFLGMEAFNTCRIFTNGQEKSVSLKCIYPMEQVC